MINEAIMGLTCHGAEIVGEGEGWELAAWGPPSTAAFGLCAAPFQLLQLRIRRQRLSHPGSCMATGLREVPLSCAWWSLPVPGADVCEKQIYFCLRFIFFTLRGVRQRISSSIESEE